MSTYFPRERTDDLCSFCRVFIAEPGSTFCGKTCQEKARLRRRRFDRSVKLLNDLGFKTTWELGCVLEIILPLSIVYAYPGTPTQSFRFPHVLTPVEEITPAYLFATIDAQLGGTFGQYLLSLRKLLRTNPRLARDSVDSYAQMLLWKDETSFLCTHCHMRSIDGQLARSGPDYMCDNCSVAAIPF